MRISTSAAAREVDRWKESVSERSRRFVSSLYFLLIAVGHRRQLVLPATLAVVMSLHFAAIQLASLLVLSMLTLRLHSYRFANVILRNLTR